MRSQVMIEVAHRVAAENTPLLCSRAPTSCLPRGARLLRQALDIMIPAGYVIHTAVLNSADNGALPQARRRSFVVGIHEDAPRRDVAFPTRVPCMAPSELLAPISATDDPGRRPTAPVAKQAVDAAWEMVRTKPQYAAYSQPRNDWLVPTRHGRKWAHCWAPRSKMPVMTHSDPKGPWVASRGRYLSQAELLRFQGIDARRWQWPHGASKGALAGNAMTVTLIARIMRSLVACATGDPPTPDPILSGALQRELRVEEGRPEPLQA